MSSEQALETVENYYRLLKERDREGLVNLLSPDIRINYYGPENLFPWVGEFVGMDGFDEFLRIIAEHFEIIEVQRLDSIANYRKVAVQCRGSWRAKTTDKVISAHMLNVFSVRDGKITGYEVYADTAAFAEGIRDD